MTRARKTPGSTADWLRRLTRDWPGVNESVKWGADLVFDVGGKMFVVTGMDTADAGRLSFKVPDDLFLAMTEQPGIVPAPYAARFKWVLVTEPARYGEDWLAAQVRTSYELVRDKLPKKLRSTLVE